MPKGERETSTRKKLHDDEYNEIMMELAEIRTELHDVNGRVKKIHKYIVWVRITTWIKRIFIILLILGLASIIQQYLPRIGERIDYFNQQIQKLHQLQTEFTNNTRR